jgi:hypothetical protein
MIIPWQSSEKIERTTQAYPSSEVINLHFRHFCGYQSIKAMNFFYSSENMYKDW